MYKSIHLIYELDAIMKYDDFSKVVNLINNDEVKLPCKRDLLY